MMNYRLLRNNKETGPYTADQLIKLGLKPYDLIWGEGKSAAWRYPCEMDEFKAYAPVVEEQPFDRFFKKEDRQKKEVMQGAGSIVIETTSPVVKTKPRIRIKADWNQVGATAAAQVVDSPQPVRQAVVKEPAVPAQQTTPQAKKDYTPSWKSSWLDWQQEKTAVQHASKTSDESEIAAAKADKKNTTGQEPVLETKFSQSLTDIKEKYAATVLKAKTKAVEWKKFKNVAILALLAIPVLSIGMWAGHKLAADKDIEKGAAVKSVIPNAQVAIVQPTEPADDKAKEGAVQQNEQKPAARKNTKEVIPSFDDDADKPASKPKNTKTSELGKTHYVPVNQKPAVVKHAVAKGQAMVKNNKAGQPNTKQPQPPAQPQRYVFTSPGNNSPQGRAKTINPALLNNQASARQEQAAKKDDDDNANPIFSHLSKKKRIEDFVTVDADESPSVGAPNLKLNVQNLADFRLDLVVIDVEYFNASGRFKAGETMYVKNIPSGETLNIKVPDNPAATRIKYKVSLVSAEQKGVYLIAD